MKEPACVECGTTKPTLYRDKGEWHCLDPERCRENRSKK